MKHKLTFFFLMVALSTLLTLRLIEIAVRTIVDDGMQYDLEMWKYARDVKAESSDPLISFRHGPNRKAKLMGVMVETNAEGLRDRHFSFDRTPGTMRVVMLGNSLTEGWGVPIEDTFSKRLERMFSEKGVQAEVINTGVGNWNTIQEVHFFLTNAYRYKPDIVVLNYAYNDAEPVPHSKPPSWWQRHCYACVFFLGRIDTFFRLFSYRKEWTDYYLGLYDDGRSQGWLNSKAAIHKLAAYCKENHIKLLIANFPELHDVQNYRFGRITELVREAAKENDVAFVDLLPYVKNTSHPRFG